MVNRTTLLLGILLVAVLGCSVPGKVAVGPSAQADADIDYTIIYLIHGDADYLYHNEEGEPHQADEEIVKEARSVAEGAARGEVFIFHQRPEQKILWLFPKKDRIMFHYRNGELVNHLAYSPEEGGAFTSESKLYRAHNSAGDSDKPVKRVLLYYGHEIPRQSQTGYYQSRSSAYFGSAGFTRGIAQFHVSGSTLFDLVVLSTCNNGTPDMVARLKDKAEYILASPQNLHLSHMDSDSLSALEREPQVSTDDLAAKIADQTFARMGEFIQTGITLSLYDTEIVGNYAEDLSRRVSKQTSRAEQKKKKAGAENIDCTELLPDEQLKSTGIRLWFKPPAFGQESGRGSHSGWGCGDLDR